MNLSRLSPNSIGSKQASNYASPAPAPAMPLPESACVEIAIADRQRQ